ncbi:MAG: NAD-dependent DNA ligase LigA, partial [Eubacterium sp.]|nr:NAD-dependent DNA ligase LigA [Eubacterium sp.]
MDKKERIKELVDILNKASKAYYQDAKEIMSNFEYDALYDELVQLEKDTGIVLANSPTVNVGYEVVSELPKEQHESPMLSLDKTKEVSVLADFAGDKKSLLSWKLDGLTVVLTYEQGKLFKAVTRGNGEIGEVITNNAKTFKNIPLSIPYEGRLVLRGEAIIKYSDFEKINREIEDAQAKYKNPRNLCSGSVRQLNSEITAKRNVNFIAFALISAENVDFKNSIEQQYLWLEQQGFEVVERKEVTSSNMEETVKYFAEKIKEYDYPSDGLVLMYDDIEYGLSLGRTAKFPRNGIAFKWEDEQAETTLEYIEWSPSRTGLINPVAVFKPVELEGTTVTRASVHNISIMEELKLGDGDTIKVYKANMIIPQISENVTKSGKCAIPEICPACGERTEIKNDNGVKTLYCPNKQCPAKHVKLYSLFVSRNAMNIDGLSEETLEKFIDAGYIHEFADIFNLSRYQKEIVETPGFGQKSYDNLIDSLNKAREVELHALLYSLGIPNIGVANAKLICKYFNNDIEKITHATAEELVKIDGIGDKMAVKFVEYFSDKENIKKFNNLLNELTIIKEENNEEQNMAGLNFVVTGSV